MREMVLNFFNKVYERQKKEDNCKGKISEHGRTVLCLLVVNGICFTSMLEIVFLNDRAGWSLLEGETVSLLLLLVYTQGMKAPGGCKV